ncbi:hypothetical protein AEAC466_13120 [Asticcacaulis sp. AC466]|uniref:hypothetical protein n=1 Tax=Asticcacaulis sp. AC466 TaxID=1282362 RepID=UPI0003C3E889|nr:hypothetical protein [Asticcacaulis sp. AC466]ESQ83610.1 hypothetical protein AEAC466_13120 [Asticcacaulis sp. AC466]
MTTREPPVNKTESRRSLWAAIVLLGLLVVACAVFFLSPQGPHDRPGADGDKPVAADRVANGAFNGRTAPVTP